MVTAKDVAALAGVSLGSVSNYLNGKRQRKSTSENIKNAMEQLNYHKNIIASGLKKNRTMSIGIVINQLTDYFSMSIISVIERYVEKYGYSIMVCDYHDDKERFEKKINFLLNRSIDAIIVFHQDHVTPMLKKAYKERVPIIAIDAPIKGLPSDAVIVNNYESSKIGVNYLIKKGYKNIGIITGSSKNYISNERQRGYEDALRQNNILIRNNYIWHGNYTIEAGYQGYNELVKTTPKLDALFIINYYMSLGAISAYRQEPHHKKLKILVYDHFFVNDIFYPEISSIEQPIEQIGNKAGKLIIERLTNSVNSGFKTIYCNNIVHE